MFRIDSRTGEVTVSGDLRTDNALRLAMVALVSQLVRPNHCQFAAPAIGSHLFITPKKLLVLPCLSAAQPSKLLSVEPVSRNTLDIAYTMCTKIRLRRRKSCFLFDISLRNPNLACSFYQVLFCSIAVWNTISTKYIMNWVYRIEQWVFLGKLII